MKLLAFVDDDKKAAGTVFLARTLSGSETIHGPTSVKEQVAKQKVAGSKFGGIGQQTLLTVVQMSIRNPEWSSG